jgi:hypothetical protein
MHHLRFPVLNLGQGASQDIAEQLRRNGAVVDVRISVPSSYAAQLQSQGQAVPPAQTAKGLVDTGASISTVSDAVARAAGLQQVGSVPIGGVGGTSERPVYAVSFGLPAFGVAVDPIEVGGVSIPMPGVDILVGRDILKALRLDYEGPQGAFNLTQDAAETPPAAAEIPATSGLPPAAWIAIAAGAGAAVVGTLFALDVF